MDSKYLPLCEVADVIDSLHQTPHYSEQGYNMVRVTDIKQGFLNLKKALYVDSETYQQFVKNHIPQLGDIIISRVGTYGEFSFVNSNEKFCLGQNTAIIAPHINSKFLFYWLISSRTKEYIQSIVTGSTQKTISLKDIKQIPVWLPSEKMQNEISDFLFTLDQKIELNKSINDNLEQQAQAMFQSLFIENADSDWPIATLSDLGIVVGGSTPSKAKPEYYTSNGIAWITPKDLSNNKSKFISHGENDITALGLKNSSASIMPKGTVLFSSRAPIGYIAIAAGEVTTNQGFKSIIPHPHIGSAFVYYFLKYNLPTIENMASGSTFKEVSGSIMKSVPAQIPSVEILEKFVDFCAPLFAQQEQLEHESLILATMRDSLLPKLMSGKLNVSEINI